MIETSAGGVVYRRTTSGAYLIQMIQDRFGKLTLAKGKLEPGETIEQAALREIQEETGVTGQIIAPLTETRYQYNHAKYGTVQKEVYYYLVEYVDGETQAQIEEINDVQWLDPREAWTRHLQTGYENNREVLRLALVQLGLSGADLGVNRYIDHTILKADATEADIRKLCAEALTYDFYSVCVHSGWVPLCREWLGDSSINIAAVCGFPFGADATTLKAREAVWAVEQGAHEIDMVLHVGQLLAGNHAYVGQDIAEVVKAAGNAHVKVIFETGYLTEDQIRIACELSVEAGAHYVKTSTGFGPGGATVQHIALMRAAVGQALGVKASGGVRDLPTALAMIDAGATRIGTSSGVAIVGGSSVPSTGSTY